MEHGHEIHYITLTRNNKIIDTSDNRYKIHYIYNANKLFYFGIKNKIHSVLNEIKPDIIYNRGRSVLTYIGAKWSSKKNVRFIWNSNGEDSCDFWKNTKKLMKSDRRIAIKCLLFLPFIYHDTLIHRGVRCADGIINQTIHQQKMLKLNYNKTGTIVSSYFKYDHLNEIIKENKLLWLANLSRVKQPEIFINLSERLHGECDWFFFLAGSTTDSVYKHKIDKLASINPNLKVLGFIPFDDTSSLFSISKIFINTSRSDSDGVPNSFIQAWLHGVPTISLNHDPNGWITENEIGFFCKGNVDYMFEKCIYLIKNPDKLKCMSERCLKFAGTQFSNPGIIKQYLNIFKGNS